jgi:hypothetical protein
MAISRDHARSWSRPLMIAAPGLKDAQLPSIAAGTSGHVGITYYAGTSPNAQLLSAYITQTSDALSAQPLFYSAPLNDPAHPIFHDYGLSDSPRTDYIGGAFDPPGTSFWAGLVKQLGPPRSERLHPNHWLRRHAAVRVVTTRLSAADNLPPTRTSPYPPLVETPSPSLRAASPAKEG